MAIFSPLFVNWVWSRHLRPDLSIEEEVVVRYFHLEDSNNNPVKYYSNRVKVVNNSRTAARECKAFLLEENNLERVGWLISYKNEGYTNNLNAFDSEYVDVCAINEDASKCIATTEYGYGKREEDARPLNANTENIRLRISAANSDPKEAYVHFFANNNDHRIFEVIRIQKQSRANNIIGWVNERTHRRLKKLHKQK